MRSRSTLEWAGIALGAVAQAVWLAVLGSVLSAADWPALAGFAAATMIAAVGAARWASGLDDRVLRGRAALTALVLLAAAALLAASHAWDHPYLVWQILRDVVFCALVVFLGVRQARAESDPDEAFARAARAFAVLCGVLVLCGLTGTSVQAPAAAVAAVIVAGGLHVAVLRYLRLTDVVADQDRLPVWPWLLAVTAAIVTVLVVTDAAAGLLGGGAIRSLLGDVMTVIAYVLSALAWLVGAALHGIAWLAGLVHLHVPEQQWPELAPRAQSVRQVAGEPPTGPSAMVRTITTTGIVILVVGISFAVVTLALRRLSRRPQGGDAVGEEREKVRSVSAATGDLMSDLKRRLRSLVRGRTAQTPAEMIRLRYEQLEGRLARAGRPRAPGATVRAYLGASVWSVQPEASAELAALYELARYSAQEVDQEQARRFEELARRCASAATEAPASVP